jgi:hypothetical protein
VVASDHGGIIEATSGTFSLAFTAAATLASGFWCIIYNSGSGTVTLDPATTEQIDGAATIDLLPGHSALVFCSGSAFETVRWGDTSGPAGSVTDGHAAVFSGTTGKLLKSAGGSPMLSVALQVFTGSDTYTPTSGMKFALVISTGGGGGGGADSADGGSRVGVAGGGGGATCSELFTASQIGASQTVTIGAAGAAGANTGGNGGAGGDTTFGALHTAGGGPGGTGAATTTNEVIAPTAGGTATGGSLNISGGVGAGGGAPGTDFAISGSGGASFWGGGAAGLVINSAVATAGRAASAYGAGGGGAININQTTGVAGGAGAAGVIVVVEFIA